MQLCASEMYSMWLLPKNVLFLLQIRSNFDVQSYVLNYQVCIGGIFCIYPFIHLSSMCEITLSYIHATLCLLQCGLNKNTHCHSHFFHWCAITKIVFPCSYCVLIILDYCFCSVLWFKLYFLLQEMVGLWKGILRLISHVSLVNHCINCIYPISRIVLFQS